MGECRRVRWDGGPRSVPPPVPAGEATEQQQQTREPTPAPATEPEPEAEKPAAVSFADALLPDNTPPDAAVEPLDVRRCVCVCVGPLG